MSGCNGAALHQKRLARRHSHNSCHMFVSIVVCACSRYALDFKMLFLISFVNKTTQSSLGFWFLVCYAATQLELRQRCIQVVCSNKEARKRLTESNGTPAMDFGCAEIRKRRYTQTKNRTKHTNTFSNLSVTFDMSV